MKLRYLADIRTLAFVVIYFGLVVGQWVLVPTQLWLAVPLFITTCFFSWFGAVMTHNTIHSPVFESQKVNRVFQVVLSLTYGSAVSAFVPGHNLSHHKYTQSSRDVMRTSKAQSRWNVINILTFAPRVAISIMRNDAAYVAAMKNKHKRWHRQYLLETYTVLLVTLGLFALDWKKALVYWLIPHIYAAWGIITINFLQHDGCDQEHPYNHSRNFVGPILNWWTFNNGYHGMHHRSPGLHWSLLKEAHERQFAPHIHPALDQKSLLGYLFSAYVFPGKRVRYDGAPLVIEPRTPDENWIPQPEETPEDLGAFATS